MTREKEDTAIDDERILFASPKSPETGEGFEVGMWLVMVWCARNDRKRNMTSISVISGPPAMNGMHSMSTCARSTPVRRIK